MKKLLALSLLFLGAISQQAGCSASAAQKKALVDAGKDLTVKVAEDVCQELATLDGGTLDPQWVALGCQAGGQIIKVILPRTEWQSIKARKAGVVDAGPGK